MKIPESPTEKNGFYILQLLGFDSQQVIATEMDGTAIDDGAEITRWFIRFEIDLNPTNVDVEGNS